MKRERDIYEDFQPIGEVLKNDKLIAFDVYLTMQGKKYIATIGTQEYLDDLIKEKEKLSKDKTLNPGELAIDPVFIVEDINDLEGIRERIMKTSIVDMEPYLTPQTEEKQN